MQRVAAAAAASFKCLDGKSRIAGLYQQGSAKIRFPKVYGTGIEAVLINTAGGLTGGDRISWELDAGNDVDVSVSTQACEKAYRTNAGTAVVDTHLRLSGASTMHWLPQETILYNQSSMSRRFTVDMDPGATFLAVESLILGRRAMGETLLEAEFRDQWRIRRNGKLVHADDLQLKNAAGSAVRLSQNRALSSFVYLLDADLEHCQEIAAGLRAACLATASGFSAFPGKVTGRILARDGHALRDALIPLLKKLRGTDLPRVWRT